jgi:hypothetical protein
VHCVVGREVFEKFAFFYLEELIGVRKKLNPEL